MLFNEQSGYPDSSSVKSGFQSVRKSQNKKFENVDKVQNNSISSSVSSSSSATNSSVGVSAQNPSIEASYLSDHKQINSPVYKTKPERQRALKQNQKNQIHRHSSVTGNSNYSNMVNQNLKDTVISDKLLSNQLQVKRNGKYSSLNKKPQLDYGTEYQKSSSYTFNTYDPNRLSSYDNNDLLQGYLSLCNNESKPDYHMSQNLIITDQAEKEAMIDFCEHTGIVPAYAKRASYAHRNEVQRDSFKKGSKEVSNFCQSNSDNSAKKSSFNKNFKTSSNNNLFARALNYAFKKNPKSDSNSNGLLNGTWKAKLGKYLGSTNGLNANTLKSTKSNAGHANTCNLDIDDDLSATYHLSRRNPINKKNTNDLNLNSSQNSAKPVNNNPSANNLNSNQLFLCLSSSSSSSASNNSTSLSTPASFEAQNILTSGKNQINYTIPNTQENNNDKETKRSPSKSKSNSQKISELASCVSQKKDTNMNSQNNSGTMNRNMINNGFNSLRKMLKISTTSDPAKSTLSTKKHKNKCLSASATPLPSCLAPNQFGTSYTDSQNSAYSSVKNISKSKKENKSKSETSPNNMVSSKLSLHQNSVTSINSMPSTPKSSKHSASLNPSNFTKSIINQTSSSFSSASLSSTNFTPPQVESKIDDDYLPNKQSYHSFDPINQSVSHTSLNVKPFQTLSNHSPELSKKNQYNQKHKAYPTNNSLKTRKEFKSEKSVLAKNTDQHNSQSQKKMINMLKVYKNVLNKMQKNTDSVPNIPQKVNVSNEQKKVPVAKVFQPPLTVHNNKQINAKNAEILKRYSDEFNNQKIISVSANKMKDLDQISNVKTSPVKVVNHENSKMINTANMNNSLKNVNKKAKRLTKISPEEEIMCDLEVASYFDERKFKNDPELFECDDVYYYEDANETQSQFAPKNSDKYIHDDHMLENDSKNLEVLVRQLAAEAALSTLNDKKMNHSKNISSNDYMKSFNDIFGKVNEQCNTNSNYLYKNKSFNNYDLVSKSSKNTKKIYGNEDKRLVYDLIENEFGLNDDDFNLINQIEHNINDNESFSDEYNQRSSESISPNNFKFIEEGSRDLNQPFNYEDEVEALLKSNASSNYEVDNIENWLDNFSNLKIKPNQANAYKNGFLSLKVKPQKNGKQLKNIYHESYLQPRKRSSSSTSFQPACNYLQIVENPNIPTRTNSITIDINNDNYGTTNNSLKNFNDNTQIKIEKKIKLNYRRPQDINSILNFGTLC